MHWVASGLRAESYRYTNCFNFEMAALKLNSSGVVRLGCSGLRQPVARAQRQVQTNAVKNPSLQKVLDLCTPCERGIATSADAKSAILDAVQELKASSGDTPKVTTGKELSATWKLVWTTEQVCTMLACLDTRISTVRTCWVV